MPPLIPSSAMAEPYPQYNPQTQRRCAISHVVTIKAEVRDPVALAAACARLGLKAPVHGTTRLYSSQATGQIVELPGWTYPVVIDTEKRQISMDTYGGAWGDQKELDKLIQAYAVCKASLEARKQGHSVTEKTLTDGSVKLTIQVGGAV